MALVIYISISDYIFFSKEARRCSYVTHKGHLASSATGLINKVELDRTATIKMCKEECDKTFACRSIEFYADTESYKQSKLCKLYSRDSGPLGKPITSLLFLMVCPEKS